MAIRPSPQVPAAASHLSVQSADQKKNDSRSSLPPRSWKVLKDTLGEMTSAPLQKTILNALNEFHQFSINYNQLSAEGDGLLRAMFEALIDKNKGAAKTEKINFSYKNSEYSGELIDQLIDDDEHAPLIKIDEVEDQSLHLRLDLKLGQFKGRSEYFPKQVEGRKRK